MKHINYLLLKVETSKRITLIPSLLAGSMNQMVMLISVQMSSPPNYFLRWPEAIGSVHYRHHYKSYVQVRNATSVMTALPSSGKGSLLPVLPYLSLG